MRKAKPRGGEFSVSPKWRQLFKAAHFFASFFMALRREGFADANAASEPPRSTRSFLANSSALRIAITSSLIAPRRLCTALQCFKYPVRHKKVQTRENNAAPLAGKLGGAISHHWRGLILCPGFRREMISRMPAAKLWSTRHRRAGSHP
jgi:hypothetical protein